MWDWIATDEQKKLRDEMRDFVRGVDKQLILDMDADRVRYPREYLEEAGRRRLLGIRFPQEFGGRAVGWTTEIMLLEEVGALGASLSCLYSLV
ncbi:MAG: acyl-CoA dehydrogenase family protein, partial [Actinomycetota bacterium]